MPLDMIVSLLDAEHGKRHAAWKADFSQAGSQAQDTMASVQAACYDSTAALAMKP
jgi:hypothetical protein